MGPYTHKLWQRAAERKGWQMPLRRDGEPAKRWANSYRLFFEHPEFSCEVKQTALNVAWQMYWHNGWASPVTMQLLSGVADTVEQAQQFIENVLPALVYAMEQARMTPQQQEVAL